MRACAVFVFYLITQAEEHASLKKRKTVNIEDVVTGLKTGGFGSIHDALRDAFESCKATKASKVRATHKREANPLRSKDDECPPQFLLNVEHDENSLQFPLNPEKGL